MRAMAFIFLLTKKTRKKIENTKKVKANNKGTQAKGGKNNRVPTGAKKPTNQGDRFFLWRKICRKFLPFFPGFNYLSYT
jgi:hypothetical protein